MHSKMPTNKENMLLTPEVFNPATELSTCCDFDSPESLFESVKTGNTLCVLETQ